MKRLILFLLFLKIQNVHGSCHQEIQSTVTSTTEKPITIVTSTTTVPTSTTESTPTPVTTSLPTSTTAKETTTTEPTTTVASTNTVPTSTTESTTTPSTTVATTTTVTTTVPTSTTTEETTTTEPTTTPSSSTVTSTPATTTITSTFPTTVSTTESTTESSSTVTTTETTTSTTEPTSSTTSSTSTVSTTDGLKSNCTNGYPIDCIQTCGCPVYTLDEAYLEKHDSYFTDKRNAGFHMNSNLTWSNCRPTVVRCQDPDNRITDWLYTIDPTNGTTHFDPPPVPLNLPPLSCNNETQRWSNYNEQFGDVAGQFWTCINANIPDDTSTTIMP